MPNKQKLISVIIPMFNEAENVPYLHDAVTKATQDLPFDFEYIFVNDGSSDTTAHLLEQLRKKDDRVRTIEFSRNFGKEAAISGGLKIAKGDAAILIDSDLQHPPELIAQFLAKWEAGSEVVVGIREYSQNESWVKKSTSELFYKILSSISHTKIVPHSTDFRLVDREVIDVFNELTQRTRIARGMIDWLGYKRDYVYFVAPLRQHGTASYTYRKLVSLAVNSFTSYSMVPLKLAGYVGVVILLLAAPSIIFITIERFILHDPMHLHITGTAFLAFILLFLVGIILGCLGLISLYIAQIHTEVMNRPLYILRRKPSFLSAMELSDMKEPTELVVGPAYSKSVKMRKKLSEPEVL